MRKINSAISRERLYSKLIDTFCILLSVASLFFLVDRIFIELGLARYAISTVEIMLYTVAVIFLFSALIWLKYRKPTKKQIEKTVALVDIKTNAECKLITCYEFIEKDFSFKEALFQDADKTITISDIDKVIYPKDRIFLKYAGICAFFALMLMAIVPAVSYEKPICDFYSSVQKGNAPITINFYDLSIGHIDNYEWDIGGIKYFSRDASHTFNKDGIFSVTLKVSGPGGKSGITKNNFITVLPASYPFSDFEFNPSTGRAPLSVKFTNLSKNADVYNWDFGDGQKSQDPSPVHVYAKPGKYTLTLEASRGSLKDTSVKKEALVVVSEKGVIADFVATPREGKAPLSVNFEDRSLGDISEHHWNFGVFNRDGLSSLKRPTYVYNLPGTYTVSLIVKGKDGESTVVKTHYIRVVDDKAGKGGFSIADFIRQLLNPQVSQQKPGEGHGKLFDAKSERPEIAKIPYGVKPIEKDGPLVEKDKKIFTKSDSKEDSKEIPYKEAWSLFNKAKEDTINSGHLPKELRDIVREYFEAIRPQ